MNQKVTVDQLSKKFYETLKAFEDVTEQACEKGVIETAENAVDALRRADPKDSGHWGSWAKYNHGWAVRKQKSKKAKGILAVVHNPEYYRLTHLLEKGHAIVRGGRVVGQAASFEHIAPVEEAAEVELLRNIRKNI